MCFKIVRLIAICNGPKRTILARCGLWLLQMVSEPDIGRCASEDIGLPKEVDCEIPRWLERGTKHFYKGVKTSPL